VVGYDGKHTIACDRLCALITRPIVDSRWTIALESVW